MWETCLLTTVQNQRFLWDGGHGYDGKRIKINEVIASMIIQAEWMI